MSITETMIHSKHLSWFFILAGIEAVLSILWLGLIPSETGNAIFRGYSPERLLLMVGMGILGILSFASLFIKFQNQTAASLIGSISRHRWIALAFTGLLFLSGIAILLPANSWGIWAGYKVRLLPIICWILLVSLEALVLFFIDIRKDTSLTLNEIIDSSPGTKKSWGIIFTIVALGIIAVGVFRIGLVPDIVYWNDINVPLLGLQIIGVTLVSILLMIILTNLGFFPNSTLPTNQFKRISPDLIICLLIWGLAFLVWTQISMPQSYFSPGPYPPNGEMYPFSDAAGYDSMAQFAAIGEGLGSRKYIDKPFYVAFLTIIHLLVGSRMDLVTGLQVAVIAFLPVVTYLLGMKLHSRLAGLISAGFVIFREANNIQGTLWVLSTNFRVLMSESLVTLLLALFVLFLALWINSKNKNEYLMVSGGFLGLAGLVRLNPFMLFPVVLLAIILISWKRWKQAMIRVLLLSVFFISAILPWTIQSWLLHGNVLFFDSTLNGVVLGQRTFYSLNQTAPVNKEESVQPTPKTQAVPQPTQPVNRTWNRITGISRYVSAHFFHNMISAVAIFPTSFQLDSLENTIKAPNSFWSEDWTGDLSPGEAIMVFLNLVFISLGAAAGWSQRKWAGLVPAGFLVFYSLATAAARTSGGRYILPADWVVMFYFALGIAQIYIWISNWLGFEKQSGIDNIGTQEPAGFHSGKKLAGILIVFLILGGLPVVLNRVVPQRYPVSSKYSLVIDLQEKGLLTQLGISQEKLLAFINLPDAVVYNGRGLYPRFYPMNKGEADWASETRAQPFPRLVMTVIGSTVYNDGVIPMSKSPDLLPNGADVLAIGCKGKFNDDWFALVVFSPVNRVYLRNPSAEWTCPAKLPVCDDNRNCQ
jgi:hypothetical protein